MALPGKRAYLAIGDVVGHGLTAAEDMTQLRNAGRTMAIVGYQPASILEELARVTDGATSGKFDTVAVVRRNMNRRHMTGDHRGGTAGRATLLARAMDEILGTHASQTSGVPCDRDRVMREQLGIDGSLAIDENGMAGLPGAAGGGQNQGGPSASVLPG